MKFLTKKHNTPIRAINIGDINIGDIGDINIGDINIGDIGDIGDILP